VQGSGQLLPGIGTTRWILRADTPLQVVDGLLSGMHPEGESSHHEVLAAFCRPSVLSAANDAAGRAGYLGHEFGDSCLLMAGTICVPEGVLAR
jgi:S-adenosylmethionine:tRNA ribosyltransferase-isomerase